MNAYFEVIGYMLRFGLPNAALLGKNQRFAMMCADSAGIGRPPPAFFTRTRTPSTNHLMEVGVHSNAYV